MIGIGAGFFFWGGVGTAYGKQLVKTAFNVMPTHLSHMCFLVFAVKLAKTNAAGFSWQLPVFSDIHTNFLTFFRSPCPHTQLHTQLMKCKRYFLQTIATKMEFALYETSDAHMHTHARRSFKRCHLSASVTKVNIHPDSSQKRDRAKSRGTVVKERKKK